jgi:hypothetical protein
MSWTNEDLRCKIDIIILTDPTRHPEKLDNLLAGLCVENQERVKAVLRDSWAFNMVERETWLTNAVVDSNFESIAVLMSYGAKPLKVCPLKNNLCAFDMLARHYHAQNRPRFYFLATLLNVGIPSNRNTGGYIAHNDHLFGSRPDDFFPDFDPNSGHEIYLFNADTALTFAVKNYLPYCVHWLIYGRGADVVQRSRNGMSLVALALECFPERPPITAPSMEHSLWAEKLEKWKKIIKILCEKGVSIPYSEYSQWNVLYGEGFEIYCNIISFNTKNKIKLLYNS